MALVSASSGFESQLSVRRPAQLTQFSEVGRRTLRKARHQEGEAWLDSRALLISAALGKQKAQAVTAVGKALLASSAEVDAYVVELEVQAQMAFSAASERVDRPSVDALLKHSVAGSTAREALAHVFNEALVVQMEDLKDW